MITTFDTIKPSNYKKAWLWQSGNLLAADIASTAVEAAIIANINSFDKSFPTISSAIQGAISIPVYYLQRPIEWTLGLTKNIEGADYYKKRMSMTEDERLKSITKAAYHYGTAVGLGWTSMAAISKGIAKLTGKPGPHTGILLKDMVIHSALVGVISLPQLAGFTTQMKDAVKCVAKSFGADENKSEDLARLTIFSGLPNYTTFALMSGKMLHDNYKQAYNIQGLHKQLSHGLTGLSQHT